MTGLRLKLHQPMADGHLEAAAIATVRWVADAGGRVVKQWWQREKSLAVSGGDGKSGDFSEFELPGGGHYLVEITRPRGPDISREFLVQEGATRSEIIQLAVSPHEYLGWQQYAGIVRADPYKRETPGARFPRGGKGEWLDNLMVQSQSRLDGLYAGAREIPSPHAVSLPAAAAAWDQIDSAVRGGDRAWARAGGRLDWASTGDAEFVTWFREMPSGGEGRELVARLRNVSPPEDELQEKYPRWVAFETGGQVDLASVPWAWWGASREQDETIRILYDLVRPGATERTASGHLRISVQDHRWFGLLEFLASGRLSRAGEMWGQVLRAEEPEMALYGKVKGPLIAVAGGIILIATALSSQETSWDKWLENLNNWFPGIPDGPILLGCRRVGQAQNIGELRAAFEHLKEGVNRGIPFFSASIRMLSMSLAQIAGDLPEAEKVRRSVSSVSVRIDPEQPFTVIRL